MISYFVVTKSSCNNWRPKEGKELIVFWGKMALIEYPPMVMTDLNGTMNRISLTKTRWWGKIYLYNIYIPLVVLMKNHFEIFSRECLGWSSCIKIQIIIIRSWNGSSVILIITVDRNVHQAPTLVVIGHNIEFFDSSGADIVMKYRTLALPIYSEETRHVRDWNDKGFEAGDPLESKNTI